MVRKENRDGGEIDIAKLIDVSPGLTAGPITVIDKGIEAGDLVVIDGLDRLRDGIPVNVAATAQTPKAEDPDKPV